MRLKTFLVATLATLTIAVPVIVVRAMSHGPAQWVDAGDTYWRDEPGASDLAAAGADLAAAQGNHAEQFYFVLPDRFANGSHANDKGGLSGDRLKTGYDPTDKGFYHGGDLAGVMDKLDYIQGLGTTAIWLAPIFKNRPVQGTGNDVSAGYHGYWITDFTQVDPHFGTKADLKKLVQLAHDRGIKIYLDVIVNHTADVIQYRENQYDYVSKKDSPYTDTQGRAFDDANYADGTRAFPDVTGNAGPYTPYFASASDATAKTPSWLNDPAMYHNRGNSTFSGENSTYGDFYGLDDLWTERPEVVQGMTKIYQDWIGATGIDGYRLDTVKHVDMDFWPQFSKGINSYAASHGKPGFFTFGEVYSADPTLTSSYVRQGGLDATLDFGFQAAAQGFVTGGSGQGLGDLYANDPLYTARGTDANALPTFLGNHDMGRIGTFIVQNGQSDALERDRLAHELMFLTRGQPVVYSGDEQGFTGAGGDKDARQDMFASHVADYLDDDLLGTDRTHAVDNYNTAHPLYRAISALGALRAAHPGLRDGEQFVRYAGDNVFAASRLDAVERVEYVVAANSSTSPKTITIDTFTPGATFGQLYPSVSSGPTAGGDGKLTITVPALSAIALQAGSQVPAPAAPGITLSPADGTTVATQATITASVTGDPAATVTFAAQVGSGPWKMLGIAQHAPYAIHHDLTGLAGKTPVHYKAVVQDRFGHFATATTGITVATPIQGAQRDYVLVHYQRPDGDYSGGWSLWNWGDVVSPPSTWPNGNPFAGEDSYGRFAWVKVKPGATNVGFLVVNSSGQKDVEADRSIDPSRTGEIWLKQGNATVYPSLAAATGYAAIHYHRPDGNYAGWGLHLWGDGLGPNTGTNWDTPRPPDGTDSFGAYWHVPVGDATKPINFIVHNGNDKDPAADLAVDMTVGEAWMTSGDATVHPTRAAAENTAVIHYRRTDGDYSGWGLHLWEGAANQTQWGSPLAPASTDAYGATFVVPLADAATALSYIVHKGDEKDLPADQRLVFATSGHEVWILSGQEKYLRPLAPSAPHDIDLGHSYAQWIDRGTIAWQKPDPDGKVYELIVSANGNVGVTDGKLTGDFTRIPLTARSDGLTEKERAAHPELWAYQSYGVDSDLATVKDALRGRLIVAESDHLGNLLSATGVQIPGALDDVYAGASAAQLGPVFSWNGRPTLSVWAPTATDVKLELFDSPTATPDSVVAMSRDDATGVWRATGGSSWSGKFYRYRVTAYQPATKTFVTASVTDPYSVSLAANSTHSQIVDLADPALAPDGWTGLHKPKVTGRSQIQELSVRDFSIADTTVPAAERGTYGAFTESGSAGMTHLKELAADGVTHLHLLPTFDFATVTERRSDQATPACDLASMPRDGEGQQACAGAVAATDGFNWGYDPLHYTVPEGSYAVNPDGSARITEYREMVQGVNNAGLRVVMDVVYNHTSAAGTDPNSVLDQIVPGYYQRLMADGSLATSTCCANTAPEHAMMGKLVVDSIVTWAKQYRVDGFRFDLMGHHPRSNILAVRSALNKLTLDKDGVDGKSIILYGEGWNFGEVANDARFVQATQANMAGTGIGTFSDRLRDAVRGGGPFDGNPRSQGFGSGLYTDPNGDPVNGSAATQKATLLHQQDLIKLGLVGNLAGYRFTDSSGASVTGAQVSYNGSPAGYTKAPGEAITYVDAHDNEILYDALAYKLPQGTSALDRARMQIVALSTVAFSQGTGFVTAGSDMLRSKSLDKNSYNSGDWFNEIRWDCAGGNGFGVGLPPAADNGSRWPYAKPLLADPALTPGCDAVSLASSRFGELMRIRSSEPLFSLATASDVQKVVSFPLSGTHETPGVITMMLQRDGKTIVVVINATPGAVDQTVAALAGQSMHLHPVLVHSTDPAMAGATYATASGTFTTPARTVTVFTS